MTNLPEHFRGQVTQKALIEKDGKVLLGKYPLSDELAAGKLDFPGGRLHEGEDTYTGLRREVMEEIGAEINVGGILAVGTFMSLSGSPTLYVIYRTTLKNPEQSFILQPEEVESVDWYDVEKFDELPIIYKEYQEAVKNYYK